MCACVRDWGAGVVLEREREGGVCVSVHVRVRVWPCACERVRERESKNGDMEVLIIVDDLSSGRVSRFSAEINEKDFHISRWSVSASVSFSAFYFPYLGSQVVLMSPMKGGKKPEICICYQ